MIKIMGTPQASVEQMKVYIKKVNPQVSDSVTKMIAIGVGQHESFSFIQKDRQKFLILFSGQDLQLFDIFC